MDIILDNKIFEFCKEHSKDPDCLCLYPSKTIEKIGTELLLPYYCWYEPCKRKTAKIPTSLRHNIQRCNRLDCSVSLGEVTLLDGILHVNNSCLSSHALASGYTIEYLKQYIHYPIIHPKYLILSLVLLALLLFISPILRPDL